VVEGCREAVSNSKITQSNYYHSDYQSRLAAKVVNEESRNETQDIKVVKKRKIGSEVLV
jgi:hypothetical protein